MQTKKKGKSWSQFIVSNNECLMSSTNTIKIATKFESVWKKNKKNICTIFADNPELYTEKNEALPIWLDENGTIRFDLPEELQGFSIAKKCLIQMASPFIPIIHIKNGTLGSRGHCCSFPQQIEELFTILSRTPDNVKIVKLIRNFVDKQGEVTSKAF